MTKREVTILAMKVLSLYTLVVSLQSLSMAGLSVLNPRWGEAQTDLLGRLMVLAPTLFSLAVSWILWAYAGNFSALIFPGDGGNETVGSRSASAFEGVAFRVLGLYVLYLALSRLVYFLVLLFVRAQSVQTSAHIQPEQFGEIAMITVELAIGLWLVLGAPRLNDVLRVVRREGDVPGE